ncbi:MAG: hypothetical protein LBV16_03665 [Elusimicrobiota bacterium]|jgi:hypothetical protein|nr:hypothetical protein [Elusimicrobiota bacterium]
MEVTDELVKYITKKILERLNGASSSDCVKSVLPTSQGGYCAQHNFSKRRVISESELKLLCPESKGTEQVLNIASRDVLTPLAMDYAHRMQIKIVRA